jgi:hypothetical protein
VATGVTAFGMTRPAPCPGSAAARRVRAMMKTHLDQTLSGPGRGESV